MLRNTTRLSHFRGRIGCRGPPNLRQLSAGKNRKSIDELLPSMDIEAKAERLLPAEEQHNKQMHQQPKRMSRARPLKKKSIHNKEPASDHSNPNFFSKLEHFLEKGEGRKRKPAFSKPTRKTLPLGSHTDKLIPPSIEIETNDKPSKAFSPKIESTKSQSLLLDALLPEVKPQRRKPSGSEISLRRGKIVSKVPDNTTKRDDTSPSSLSFFGHVEQFVQNEKSLKDASSSSASPTQKKSAGESARKAYASSQEVNQGMGIAALDHQKKSFSYAPKKSIFDVFKVPEPAPPRSENAFEEEAWNAYEEILHSFYEEATKDSDLQNLASALTEEDRKDVEEWLKADEPKAAVVHLPTLLSACEDGIENMMDKATDDEALKRTAQTELQKQKNAFTEELKWNNKQHEYAGRMVHALTEYSYENHKALPIVILWEKMKELGYVRKKTIGVCLSAASSFSGGILTRNRAILTTSPRNNLLDLLDSKDASASIESKPNNQRAKQSSNVPEQLAAINDLLYLPTEQSTSIRTRRLISLGDTENALKLIEERMSGEAKLRAYPQVFSLYLELGDIRKALLLLQKMKEGHRKVELQPELFIQLLAATAEKGYFCHHSDPIEDIAELGYSESSGPGLFDQLASEMSLYVDSISSASAKRLHKAFKRGFGDSGESKLEFDVSAFAPLQPLIEPVTDTDLVAHRVSVDASSGFCHSLGTYLRLVEVEKSHKNRLKEGLLKIVGKNQSGLESFWAWLSHRTDPPFTVLVDGANVAYYMQNFDKGRFNYSQIKFVVDALENSGEVPLVLIPQKYLQDSFTVYPSGRKATQTLNDGDRSIIDGLKKGGKLWAVPRGCNDDYFWISATVIDQAKSPKRGRPKKKSQGLMLSSGSHPVVVTNDQIRDHKELELLEAKAFNRWYSNTIVNYNFTGFVGDECVDPDIAFSPADRYSHEIQGNSSGKDGVGTAWHFPVKDWETSDWFCIRIPIKRKV